MGFDFECCDLAATAHGTCCKCIESGRHELAGRAMPVAAPEAKPMYLRLRDGTSITRMNAGSIMREHGRGRGLVLAMAHQGPRWWLANPTNINHPLLGH